MSLSTEYISIVKKTLTFFKVYLDKVKVWEKS